MPNRKMGSYHPGFFKKDHLDVFVTYGDTTEFTPWAKRGATSEKSVDDYLDRMFYEIRSYEIETGFHVKYLCDGFVSFKEATDKQNDAFLVLRSAWKIQKKMESVISGMDHPRPPAFRVRVLYGMVSEFIIPTVQEPVIDRHESVGYSSSLGDRLLDIFRDKNAVCTETVRSMCKNQRLIVFKSLAVPDHVPPQRGTDQEDMRELHEFQFIGKS